MQVEYVLVTMSDSDYEFTGDIKSIPEPVRAPRGYSIVDDLRKKGLKVITHKTERNLRSVARMKKGSVITIPTNAKILLEKLNLTDTMKIHETPIKSKSYFMLFSRNTSKISMEEISAVWKEIAKLRDDMDFMGKLQNKYE